MSKRSRMRHFLQPPSQLVDSDFERKLADIQKHRKELQSLVARLRAGEAIPELEPPRPSGLISDYGYEQPSESGSSVVLTWDPDEERRRLVREGTRDRARRRNALIRGASTAEKVSRAAIIERDKSTCYLCGKVCEAGEIHLDHVIPVSRGGAHSPDNLRVACGPCNSRKGARLLPSFSR